MSKKSENIENSCGPCCSLESIVSIDERGQMVLPRDVREKAGIKAGDKLAIVSFEDNGAVTCVALIPANRLAGSLQEMFGPLGANSTPTKRATS